MFGSLTESRRHKRSDSGNNHWQVTPWHVQCYQWLIPRHNTCLNAEALVDNVQNLHMFCPEGFSKLLLCACLEVLRHFAALIGGMPRCQHIRVPHKCPVSATVPLLHCCTWVQRPCKRSRTNRCGSHDTLQPSTPQARAACLNITRAQIGKIRGAAHPSAIQYPSYGKHTCMLWAMPHLCP